MCAKYRLSVSYITIFIQLELYIKITNIYNRNVFDGARMRIYNKVKCQNKNKILIDNSDTFSYNWNHVIELALYHSKALETGL